MDNDATTTAATVNATPGEEAKTNPDPAGNQGGTATPADDKTKGENLFTQEDASALAAREAKKAREGLLRQLGIRGDDVKSVAERLKQYDAWQAAQKTEAERKVVALGKGVPADKLDDYVSPAAARMSDVPFPKQ